MSSAPVTLPRRSVASRSSIQERNTSMKTSARNQFKGTVRELIKGPVSAELTIAVTPGVEIVATISTRSAEGLGLAVGKSVYALVKASSVVVATD